MSSCRANAIIRLDIALPLNGSIDRSSPAWTTNLLDEYTNAINTFNKYNNVLAYTIANEVVTTNANTAAARMSSFTIMLPFQAVWWVVRGIGVGWKHRGLCSGWMAQMWRKCGGGQREAERREKER